MKSQKRKGKKYHLSLLYTTNVNKSIIYQNCRIYKNVIVVHQTEIDFFMLIVSTKSKIK